MAEFGPQTGRAPFQELNVPLAKAFHEQLGPGDLDAVVRVCKAWAIQLMRDATGLTLCLPPTFEQLLRLLEALERRFPSVHCWRLWLPAGKDWSNLDELLWLLSRYTTETLTLNGAPSFCINDGWDAAACVPKTMPVVEPEAVRTMAALRSLQNLLLHDCLLQPQGLPYLLALPSLTRLEFTSSMPQLQDQGLAPLLPHLKRLPRLRCLRIGAAGPAGMCLSGAVARHAAGLFGELPKLQELSVACLLANTRPSEKESATWVRLPPAKAGEAAVVAKARAAAAEAAWQLQEQLDAQVAAVLQAGVEAEVLGEAESAAAGAGPNSVVRAGELCALQQSLAQASTLDDIQAALLSAAAHAGPPLPTPAAMPALPPLQRPQLQGQASSSAAAAAPHAALLHTLQDQLHTLQGSVVGGPANVGAAVSHASVAARGAAGAPAAASARRRANSSRPSVRAGSSTSEGAGACRGGDGGADSDQQEHGCVGGLAPQRRRLRSRPSDDDAHMGLTSRRRMRRHDWDPSSSDEQQTASEGQQHVADDQRAASDAQQQGLLHERLRAASDGEQSWPEDVDCTSLARRLPPAWKAMPPAHPWCRAPAAESAPGMGPVPLGPIAPAPASCVHAGAQQPPLEPAAGSLVPAAAPAAARAAEEQQDWLRVRRQRLMMRRLMRTDDDDDDDDNDDDDLLGELLLMEEEYMHFSDSIMDESLSWLGCQQHNGRGESRGPATARQRALQRLLPEHNAATRQRAPRDGQSAAATTQPHQQSSQQQQQQWVPHTSAPLQHQQQPAPESQSVSEPLPGTPLPQPPAAGMPPDPLGIGELLEELSVERLTMHFRAMPSTPAVSSQPSTSTPAASSQPSTSAHQPASPHMPRQHSTAAGNSGAPSGVAAVPGQQDWSLGMGSSAPVQQAAANAPVAAGQQQPHALAAMQVLFDSAPGPGPPVAGIDPPALPPLLQLAQQQRQQLQQRHQQRRQWQQQQQQRVTQNTGSEGEGHVPIAMDIDAAASLVPPHRSAAPAPPATTSPHARQPRTSPGVQPDVHSDAEFAAARAMMPSPRHWPPPPPPPRTAPPPPPPPPSTAPPPPPPPRMAPTSLGSPAGEGRTSPLFGRHLGLPHLSHGAQSSGRGVGGDAGAGSAAGGAGAGAGRARAAALRPAAGRFAGTAAAAAAADAPPVRRTVAAAATPAAAGVPAAETAARPPTPPPKQQQQQRRGTSTKAQQPQDACIVTSLQLHDCRGPAHLQQRLAQLLRGSPLSALKQLAIEAGHGAAFAHRGSTMAVHDLLGQAQGLTALRLLGFRSIEVYGAADGLWDAIGQVEGLQALVVDAPPATLAAAAAAAAAPAAANQQQAPAVGLPLGALLFGNAAAGDAAFGLPPLPQPAQPQQVQAQQQQGAAAAADHTCIVSFTPSLLRMAAARLHHLRTLEFRGDFRSYGRPDFLSALSALTQLRALRLEQLSGGWRGRGSVLDLGWLPKGITRLGLVNISLSTAAAEAASARLQQLRGASGRGSRAGASGGAAVAREGASLLQGHARRGDAAGALFSRAAAVAPPLPLAGLRELFLEDCAGTEAAFAACLRHCSGLTGLQLLGKLSPIPLSLVEVAAAWWQLQEVVVLEFARARVSGTGSAGDARSDGEEEAGAGVAGPAAAAAGAAAGPAAVLRVSLPSSRPAGSPHWVSPEGLAALCALLSLQRVRLRVHNRPKGAQGAPGYSGGVGPGDLLVLARAPRLRELSADLHVQRSCGETLAAVMALTALTQLRLLEVRMALEAGPLAADLGADEPPLQADGLQGLQAAAAAAAGNGAVQGGAEAAQGALQLPAHLGALDQELQAFHDMLADSDHDGDVGDDEGDDDDHLLPPQLLGGMAAAVAQGQEVGGSVLTRQEAKLQGGMRAAMPTTSVFVQLL